VIDTKGVEGTTQRPDLKAQIDDPRTVTIVCTRFSDAPGATAISIIRELIDSGSDALDSERICLLVVVRDDEALKIVDGSGSNPESAEYGYAIRETQINQQFAMEGLPVLPVNFYNVGTDEPAEVWNWLKSGIGRLRENKTVRIKRLLGAAQDLAIGSDQFTKFSSFACCSVMPGASSLPCELGCQRLTWIAADIANLPFLTVFLAEGKETTANILGAAAFELIELFPVDLEVAHFSMDFNAAAEYINDCQGVHNRVRA
jgi:hypothetical protein